MLQNIEKSFNYNMVVLARESRGITQTSLAKSINISQGNLSKIEQGLSDVGIDVIIKISKALNYPISFFQENINQLPVNHQFHRKRKSIGKRHLSLIDASLTIRRLHLRKLLQSIEIEDNIIKLDIEKFGSPETIAQKVRHHWKLPAGPIKNLVGLLESKGLIIIYTKIYDKLDGMAVPSEENIPLIYLNKNKTIDRQRFTLAHEFGHIVMHTDYIPKVDDDVENEADKFAAELLMPCNEFTAMTKGKYITIEELAFLKRYWRTSMASILYRLNHLEIITPQRYRSLNVELSRIGYRKHEPILGIPHEEPRLLNELVKSHLDNLNYSTRELAEVLRMNLDEFEKTYLHKNIKLAHVRKI
ncbi:MAG: XRE family transcriptional regulator [Bacteroidota bacterium]